MPERARTKDETFMIKLYETAKEQADIEDPIDRYAIGAMAGLHPKGADGICALLIRANFIKKHGQIEISITPQGIRLVEELNRLRN